MVKVYFTAKVRGYSVKTQKVIGLWLDTTSTWIISRDEIYCDGSGENASNRTVVTYATEDYADAKAHAIDLAQQSDLCVIKTNEDQTQECIYQPEGQSNPLVKA